MRLIPATFGFAMIAGSAMAAGSAADGQHDFARCTACHSSQPGHNGIGPSLASVVGRQSGTEAGYHYSAAMSGAHITWDNASLDRFLANPQGSVHGTKMFIAVPDAQQRQDIIAYLDTLK
ncbi:MAG TPA: c-type cytochrome [Acetobacteraceae bacterium]|jgi:cytochrome c|nr:c-type cytochrome [Acetobacteraceae bacterium]